MSFLIITFFVSLLGILLLVGIRAFELKANKIIINDSFRKRADQSVHSMTDKLVSGVHHLLLLFIRFVGHFTGRIYKVLKRFMSKIERRVSLIYRYVRGHMELSKKVRVSKYMESMKKYKEHINKSRKHDIEG